MKNFSNKIAIVTGGNSGIGYATASALTEAGATVIITGRRKEAIEKAAAEIGAVPVVADQSSLKDITALVAQVTQDYGKVDILFINAGIVGDSTLIENAAEENFDQVMDINFKGAYFTLSKFIPVLADEASVVILSSIVAGTYNPYSSVYQASKAALNSIARTAAAELAPRKIRVNIVSPGPIRTAVLSKNGMDKAAADALLDKLAAEDIPLRKVGAAADVARLVTYLSDHAASYITGSEFVIDGGITL